MTIHYQVYGNPGAALMVFLHGGGVSGWMWNKQVQYFAADYHCLVPDLPGHGASHFDTTFSIPSCAEELISLIKQAANSQEIILIGFSLGAQVAIQMLSIEPELFDYAIINSALVRPSPHLIRWIKPSIRFSYPLIKVRSFSKLQAKVLYIDDEHFETYYKESTQMKPETLISILEANMSFTLPSNFNKVRGKLLVTVGDKEKAVMKQSATDIVMSNACCVGIRIPGIGHGVSLAKPDYFNQLITQWVQAVQLPEACSVIANHAHVKPP
jgi:pimeloyl-ACP methyl ester carboxylesterase